MSNKELNLRIFGAVYFPIQFLIVWVLYFGLVLEPSPYSLYRAFNVSGIIDSVFSLVATIPMKIITTEHVLNCIFSFIPHLLIILLNGYRVYLFLFVLIQLIMFIVANISVLSRKMESLKQSVNVIIKIGSPGSGKSSSAIYDAILKAQKMWQQLQFDYWRYSAGIEKWLKYNNIEKIQQWYEIRDAYNFYISTDCIPCLWSNIPVSDLYGQNANALTVDHLYQQIRLPAFAVLFVDEIGSMLDVDLYKDKPFELSNMFRFCRHFGNFLIIGTEQSAENVYIDVRRVVSFHEYMLGQKWVNKPYLFIALYNIFKWFFTKIQKGAKFFAPAMNLLNDLIRHVGFRKYIYAYEGNTERCQSSYSNGKRCYYLPSCLNFFYDDRTYRNYYLPKDYPLESQVFKSLVLASETEAGKIYLRMKEEEAAAELEELQSTSDFIDKLLSNHTARTQAESLMKESDFRNKLINKTLECKELRDKLEKLR